VKEYQTEAEIQAEFYYRCRRAGIGCRVEFSSRVGRLDLLVTAPGGNAGVIVIEVKRSADKLCEKQLAKYRWLKLPVFTLCAKEEIGRLLERIRNKIPEVDPISLDELRGTLRRHVSRAKPTAGRRSPIAACIPAPATHPSMPAPAST